MSLQPWSSSSALPWLTCPVHGFHGRHRCPTCSTAPELELAIAAPLIALPFPAPLEAERAGSYTISASETTLALRTGTAGVSGFDIARREDWGQ